MLRMGMHDTAAHPSAWQLDSLKSVGVMDVAVGVWYFVHLVCVLMWPLAVPFGILLILRRINIIRSRRRSAHPPTAPIC
jgi:hypothetical protein